MYNVTVNSRYNVYCESYNVIDGGIELFHVILCRSYTKEINTRYMDKYNIPINKYDHHYERKCELVKDITCSYNYFYTDKLFYTSNNSLAIEHVVDTLEWVDYTKEDATKKVEKEYEEALKEFDITFEQFVKDETKRLEKVETVKEVIREIIKEDVKPTKKSMWQKLKEMFGE
jgi:hypothetical protein